MRHERWLAVVVVFLFQIPSSTSSSSPSTTHTSFSSLAQPLSSLSPRSTTPTTKPPTAFQTFSTKRRIIPAKPPIAPLKTPPSPHTTPSPKPSLTTTTNSLTSSLPMPVQRILSSIAQNSGIFLAFFIILTLALTREGAAPPTSVTSLSIMEESVARGTLENVMTTALPSSSTDLFSAALGESIGGILGASAAVVISMVGVMGKDGVSTVQGKGGMSGSEMKKMRSPLITEAIADSDFFIANSASSILLETVGIPASVASVVSVVFASVPSQFVKALGRDEVRREEEKESLLREELLREEEENKRLKQSAWRRLVAPVMESLPNKGKRTVESSNVLASSSAAAVVLSSSGDEEGTKSRKSALDLDNIDLVEVFSDCTRWLSYDVLRTDFGENIIWNGLVLDSTLTGVLFGTIAAISSQLYADVLYGVFKYGPERRRTALSERTTRGTIALYTSRSVSTATLFGVYEFVQGPVSRYIQGTLAGGVDGCAGSSNFEVCLQSYIEVNAPGPSAEAQFRALVINLGMVGQRLQDIAGDTSWDDLVMLVRSWHG